MCENQKQKKKYGNKRYFYIKIHLSDRLDIEFTACQSELMPEEALTSFTVFDAYRWFAGQAQSLKSKSRSRIEYLIPMSNIIVIDSYFNFTSKSNLTDRL